MQGIALKADGILQDWKVLMDCRYKLTGSSSGRGRRISYTNPYKHTYIDMFIPATCAWTPGRLLTYVRGYWCLTHWYYALTPTCMYLFCFQVGKKTRNTTMQSGSGISSRSGLGTRLLTKAIAIIVYCSVLIAIRGQGHPGTFFIDILLFSLMSEGFEAI